MEQDVSDQLDSRCSEDLAAADAILVGKSSAWSCMLIIAIDENAVAPEYSQTPSL
jgi:hypothetical protein